jgi:hypothetical protein
MNRVVTGVSRIEHEEGKGLSELPSLAIEPRGHIGGSQFVARRRDLMWTRVCR